MKMFFQSVTFDLDGTLADTIDDLAEACRLMLAELGEPPRSPAEVRSFVGNGMRKLVERCLTHAQAPSAERLNDAVAVFQRHYDAVNGHCSKLYPAVMEGLEEWRVSGLRMGVVSNKPGLFTDVLLERLGIADFFDIVVAGDTCEHHKPHPEPLLHACSWLGVEPSRNLHIGDSWIDIETAKAAGCPVYFVPYGYNNGRPVDRADCDALVSDLLSAYRTALNHPTT
jgi:phosphoglycolate phosphatase